MSCRSRGHCSGHARAPVRPRRRDPHARRFDTPFRYPGAMATAELPITGMTCASCANRIERRLNRLDGVTATVNYATEKATVSYDAAEVAPEQLVAAVEAAGYQAALPAAEPETIEAQADETAPLRRRLIA